MFWAPLGFEPLLVSLWGTQEVEPTTKLKVLLLVLANSTPTLHPPPPSTHTLPPSHPPICFLKKSPVGPPDSLSFFN